MIYFGKAKFSFLPYSPKKVCKVDTAAIVINVHVIPSTQCLSTSYDSALAFNFYLLFTQEVFSTR